MSRLRIGIIVLFLISCNNSYADDVEAAKSSAKGKISSFFENSIGRIIDSKGGDSEVKITAGEDIKPTFTIMSVRPISPHSDDSALFVQLQINNLKVRGKERFSLDAGLGKRFLSEDKNTITGFNAFIDYDEEGNSRASLGLEFRKSAFEAIINTYSALSGGVTVGTFTERVLDGTEISLIGELPYLPWASVIYNHYEWKADQNSRDSKGDKISAEMVITPSLIVEIGQDDHNISGNSNFAKVSLVFPPREKSAASTGLIGKTMFSSGDMSSKMLSKVRRTNSMVIESEGSGVVIARATE